MPNYFEMGLMLLILFFVGRFLYFVAKGFLFPSRK